MIVHVAAWSYQKHGNFSLADVEQNVLAPSSLRLDSATTKCFTAQSKLWKQMFEFMRRSRHWNQVQRRCAFFFCFVLMKQGHFQASLHRNLALLQCWSPEKVTLRSENTRSFATCSGVMKSTNLSWRRVFTVAPMLLTGANQQSLFSFPPPSTQAGSWTFSHLLCAEVLLLTININQRTTFRQEGGRVSAKGSGETQPHIAEWLIKPINHHQHPLFAKCHISLPN